MKIVVQHPRFQGKIGSELRPTRLRDDFRYSWREAGVELLVAIIQVCLLATVIYSWSRVF